MILIKNRQQCQETKKCNEKHEFNKKRLNPEQLFVVDTNVCPGWKRNHDR